MSAIPAAMLAADSAAARCLAVIRLRPEISSPEYGLTYVATVPGTPLVNDLARRERGEPMVQTERTNRLTVLLANEQEGWHQTIRGLLEPQGVQTLSARSGREALDLMESRPIHVAVLDQSMPQLGGLQVVKLMRDRKNAPPAILLANQLTNNLLREALSMQVFTVLGKPVDLNVLLDALARVLRRYHESRWPQNEVTE